MPIHFLDSPESLEGVSQMNGRMQRFTLFEIMIVVAIIGVVLTLAIPNYQRVMVNNRSLSIATIIHEALDLAQSEAMKRGKTVAICAENAEHSQCDYSRTDWEYGWRVFELDSKEVIKSYPAIAKGYLYYCCNGHKLEYTPEGKVKPIQCHCPAVVTGNSTDSVSIFKIMPEKCSQFYTINIDSTGKAFRSKGENCS